MWVRVTLDGGMCRYKNLHCVEKIFHYQFHCALESGVMHSDRKVSYTYKVTKPFIINEYRIQVSNGGSDVTLGTK